MFCNCCFFSFFKKKKNQLVPNATPQQLPLLQQTQQLTQQIQLSTQNFFSFIHGHVGNQIFQQELFAHQNLNNQTLPQAVQQQLFANQNLNNVEQLYQQFFVTYQNQAFNKPPVSYFPCQQDG